MADRQLLPKTAAPGSYPPLPPAANSLDVVFTAADVANKDSFVASGNDLVLAWNTDGVNPHTVTASSVADEKKRTGDVTAYSIGAGEIVVLGPFKKAGWMQPSGHVHLDASDAAVKFAVIAL